MADALASDTIARVFREEYGRVVAGLVRLLGKIDLAEESVQEAFVVATQRWPETGLPPNPGAWITVTARNRALDRLRRESTRAQREQRATMTDAHDDPFDVGAFDEAAIVDERLRLIFTCCHPALAPDAQVALTLRLLGGLHASEIARAFLVPEPTIAQRITRAKRTLSEARVPFEVPRGAELEARLSSVLEVVYLIFNEGYAATEGADWMRPALCEEALRLGRVLAELAPREPEVHGLVALMEIQASRLRARVGPKGEPVLLLDQDRGRWDWLLVGRGLAALERAERLGGEAGPYVLQASLAACHARARVAEETDWERIAALYEELGRVTPSPVVELNRAVAVSMAEGPAAGLAIADALRSEPSLKNYHLLPAVRGDLLARLGRDEEARAEFERAASLTRNSREREVLLGRAAACAS